MRVSSQHQGGLLLGLVAVALALSAAPGSDPDPFARVDLEFRAAYADARAATLDRLDPFVIVEGDQLILVRGGRRAAADVIPPIYHRLKAVAHVPLAVFVSLHDVAARPLDADRVARLVRLRDEARTVAAALDSAGFAPAQLVRQRRILERSIAVLDSAIESRDCPPDHLLAFTRGVGPLVLASAGDAARAQIDAYQGRMAAWRQELPADEWDRLRVLVIGLQMPRRHNVAVQFFAKLLGLPGESRRLVYAEHAATEDDALHLLATHELDAAIAAAFFDDPNRMEYDLLGNAAAAYLDTLELEP